MAYKEILAKQIPEFISGTKLFSNVQRVQGWELDNLGLSMSDMELQLSPLTATWSLSIWERIFGIPTNTTDDDDTRRAKILAETANISPLTPIALETILSKFATDVDVKNVPGEYKFTVTFNVDNNSKITDNILDTIEKVKPAHLEYDILFGFKNGIQIFTNYTEYEHNCLYCGTFLSGQNYL